MGIKSILCIGIALAALVSSAAARADGNTPAAGAPAVETQRALLPPAPESAPVPAPERPDRGRFSGKRLIVEVLAGAVVGSLVGVGVYEAAGGDGIGAAFAGLGSDIVITPVVVWGTGKAMGGRGTLGWAYLGGLTAFAGPAATPEQAALSLAVGMALMPITSAILYEVSSHARSRRFEKVANGVAIAPVVDARGISGVRAGLSLGF